MLVSYRRPVGNCVIAFVFMLCNCIVHTFFVNYGCVKLDLLKHLLAVTRTVSE
jgi:hypothetical protein